VSDGVRAGVWGRAREALLDALALVLPTECAGCGTEGRELCTACRGRLASALVRAASPGGIRVYAGASYDELVRRVVLACKQGRTGLAGALAALLAEALADALADTASASPVVELCAVPSTRAADRPGGVATVRHVLARNR
jgi:predicted amidophosphoribosyltransferase